MSACCRPPWGCWRPGAGCSWCATAWARAPESKETAIERLRLAGAAIVTAEMVAFEWLRTCEHAAFRKTVDLIKARDRAVMPKGAP